MNAAARIGAFPPSRSGTAHKPLNEPLRAGELRLMSYSVGEAAQLAGRSRATIKRLITSGTLSASRSGPGKPWVIDAAELARVFPAPAREPRSEQLNEPARADNERA